MRFGPFSGYGFYGARTRRKGVFSVEGKGGGKWGSGVMMMMMIPFLIRSLPGGGIRGGIQIYIYSICNKKNEDNFGSMYSREGNMMK